MRIEHDENGVARVVSYDLGDMVLLRIDEGGEMPMGRAGDWGAVVQISPGGAHLDIKIAGHSASRKSTVRGLTDIPIRIVQPCDSAGKPIPLPHKGVAVSGTLRERGGQGWKRSAGAL
ncbi:hypothetical protein ACQW02_05230 [Humitalea sp. 24SJ18S-53]|uniref:hypothetical protein n=1 Tax=Humitalea sp. 24SJ18S-53 TaxID=3422307 RepID=UPI003D66CCD6